MTDRPFNAAVLMCRKNMIRLRERAHILHEQLTAVEHMIAELEDEFEYLTEYLKEDPYTAGNDTDFYIPAKDDPFR